MANLIDIITRSITDFFTYSDNNNNNNKTIVGVPTHIAFVMDGNRRWAKKRGMGIIKGHYNGARNVTRIITKCNEIGVKYVTLYAFSKHNWKRDSKEVSDLMNLFGSSISNIGRVCQKYNTRFRLMGEREGLPQALVKKINDIEALTVNNNKMTVCVAMNYSGRGEIVSACRKMNKYLSQNSYNDEDIDENFFRGFMYLPDVPDPDLVIRTSGEFRTSDFMNWQISQSELYFTNTLWPDFDENELVKAIYEFNGRERRLGK